MNDTTDKIITLLKKNYKSSKNKSDKRRMLYFFSYEEMSFDYFIGLFKINLDKSLYDEEMCETVDEYTKSYKELEKNGSVPKFVAIISEKNNQNVVFLPLIGGAITILDNNGEESEKITILNKNNAINLYLDMENTSQKLEEKPFEEMRAILAKHCTSNKNSEIVIFGNCTIESDCLTKNCAKCPIFSDEKLYKSEFQPRKV